MLISSTTTNIQIAPTCHSRKLDILYSPDVRIKISGSGDYSVAWKSRMVSHSFAMRGRNQPDCLRRHQQIDCQIMAIHFSHLVFEQCTYACSKFHHQALKISLKCFDVHRRIPLIWYPAEAQSTYLKCAPCCYYYHHYCYYYYPSLVRFFFWRDLLSR